MDSTDLDDVILFLLPHKGEGFESAASATSIPENKSRVVKARHNIAKPRSIVPRHEREGTELPEEYGLLENTNCLMLRFSHGARTSVGVVGGCAGHVDLVFHNIPGVSKIHLAFTFDDKTNMPIARDLGSTGGTKVTYNGEPIAKGKHPILNITDRLQFKVIVPHRDFASPDYIEKVKRFRLGTADPENLFASLLIPRLPTGQQTASAGGSSRQLLYKEILGEGSFGLVTYVWNSTTREEYVVKSPLQKLIDSGLVSLERWMEEADIMRSISHEHIVAFRDATFDPHPQLEFEYVPGGSLEKYTDVSALESTQILCQLSSALEYLHNKKPSVGHRDIKPENILVVDRTADGIRVKFADFGLSKAADTLKTCCGTPGFAAPEIYLKIADTEGAADDTYGVAVDIWSLGVVIASLVCGGLPAYDNKCATDAFIWIRAVQNHVVDVYNRQGGELLWLLIDGMLVEDPDERSSADYVHDEAVRILECMTSNESDDDDHGDEGSATPKASMLAAQPAVGSEDPEEAPTFRLDIQPALDGSRTSIRETVESPDASLIENRSNATSTDCGEEARERLDAPNPETQLGLVPEGSGPLSPGSTVNGLLWDPEAGELNTGEDDEEHDMFPLLRYELGEEEVQGDGAGAVDAPEGSRSVRKRTWPETTSSPSSLPGSFTHPLSSAGRRRTTSKGSPAHKRSKMET